MLGLILFLVFVLLLIYVMKEIIAALSLPPNIQRVAYLLLTLLVVVWLFGFGGWPHVYGWRP